MTTRAKVTPTGKANRFKRSAVSDSEDKSNVFRVDTVVLKGTAKELVFTGHQRTHLVDAIDKFIADMSENIRSNFAIAGLHSCVNDMLRRVADSHPGLHTAKPVEEILPG